MKRLSHLELFEPAADLFSFLFFLCFVMIVASIQSTGRTETASVSRFLPVVRSSLSTASDVPADTWVLGVSHDSGRVVVTLITSDGKRVLLQDAYAASLADALEGTIPEEVKKVWIVGIAQSPSELQAQQATVLYQLQKWAVTKQFETNVVVE